VKDLYEYGNTPPGSIKYGKYLDSLTYFQKRPSFVESVILVMKSLRSNVKLPVCPFATFIIHNYITHLTSLLVTPLVMLQNEGKVPQSFETSLAT